MNPSGILFGPNAQLDVSGSFYATTANYVGLEDGTHFNAVATPDGPLLTTAPPQPLASLMRTQHPSRYKPVFLTSTPSSLRATRAMDIRTCCRYLSVKRFLSWEAE